MKAIRFFALLILIIIGFLSLFNSCKKEPPTVFEKAVEFVKIHSSEEYLKSEDGMFLLMEGEHKASDWVSYFFSIMSTRNWISEVDEFAEYSSAPKLPVGIHLSNGEVNKDTKEPQLVVRADNVKKLIIAEGYEFPPKNIVFNEQWEFKISK